MDENFTEETNNLTVVVYKRPENHYIRYIEPTEEELFETVEYDMDEQDEVWLQMLNAVRKKENLGEVSCALFENIMDKLEKEWFDLVKHLPKQINEEPILPEDSTCAICDDGECENSNAIVFCDGCNLAVHQDCYGVPYIPEGQWLCRKCIVSPDKPVSCLFCPNEGGAFKQTNTNKWSHLLCALWIPEVDVGNLIYMEPIDNIESIPKSRWKLSCYICRKKHGACIQCDNKHCFTAFHVTCARWARLCMRMKTHVNQQDGGVALKAYCDKHTPRDYRDEVDVEKCVLAAQEVLDPKSLRNKGLPSSSCIPRMHHIDEFLEEEAKLIEYQNENENDDDTSDSDFQANTEDEEDEFEYNDEEEEEDEVAYSSKRKNKRKRKGDHHHHHRSLKKRKQRSTATTAKAMTKLTPSLKAARAHQHHYSADAPVAPDYILNKLEILKCIRQQTNLRKRAELITSISRYWSLKRESRRGAPLLKRLHLEPWTASSSLLKQSEVEKAHRASAMMTLRSDLERVRMLSEQVQKREKQKLDRIRRQKEYIDMVLFPVEYIVKPILNQLMELDKRELFFYPVTTEMAPDYHDIIEHPMCFTDIIGKFHSHEYESIDAVETDLALIWSNSKTYNRTDTAYYKLAQRMEDESIKLMKVAREEFSSLEISAQSGTLAVGIDPEIFEYKSSEELKPVKEEDTIKKEELESDMGAQTLSSSPSTQLESKSIVANASESQETKPKSNSFKRKREKVAKELPVASSHRRSTRSNPEPIHHSQLEKKPRKKRLTTRSLANHSHPSSTSPSSSSLSSLSSSPSSSLSSSSPSSLHLAGSSSASPISSTPLTDEESFDMDTSIPSTLSKKKETKHSSTSKKETPMKSSSPSSSSTTSSLSSSSLSSSTSSPPRRRTRSSGTSDLTIPTIKNMKNRKITSELKKLLTNSFETKPIAYEEGSYKESKTAPTIKGYVIVSSPSSSENEEEKEEVHTSKMKRRSTRRRLSTLQHRHPKHDHDGHDHPTKKEETNDEETEEEEFILKMEKDKPTIQHTPKKNKRGSSLHENLKKKKILSSTFKPIKQELLNPKIGSIVWARVPGFPAHPAKIVDPDSIKMSNSMLSNRTPSHPLLVEFYEVPVIHRWGWIRKEDVFLLGDEPTDLLVIQTVKKLYKNKYLEVIQGYKHACQLLSIKPQTD
ncbi:unnamed protein product [Cunninghamella blakesleeana]